jgi:hypothetical protein
MSAFDEAAALVQEALHETIDRKTREGYMKSLDRYIIWARKFDRNPCDENNQLILPVDVELFTLYLGSLRKKSDNKPYSDGPIKKVTSALKRLAKERNKPLSFTLQCRISDLIRSQQRLVADSRKRNVIKRKAGKDLLTRKGYEALSIESIKVYSLYI